MTGLWGGIKLSFAGAANWSAAEQAGTISQQCLLSFCWHPSLQQAF